MIIELQLIPHLYTFQATLVARNLLILDEYFGLQITHQILHGSLVDERLLKSFGLLV